MSKTKNNVVEATSDGLPIGSIVPFSGTLNVESFKSDGWLYCNGNSISRTDYAGLFDVIKENYGAGDGTSTFNLPDLRGTFLRGVSGASTNDPDAAARTPAASGGNTGDNVGSVQSYATQKPTNPFVTNQAGEHSHSVDHIPNDNSSYAVAGSYQAIWNGGSASTDAAGNHTHQIVGGGDLESRGINAYTYFLIRFQ